MASEIFVELVQQHLGNYGEQQHTDICVYKRCTKKRCKIPERNVSFVDNFIRDRRGEHRASVCKYHYMEWFDTLMCVAFINRIKELTLAGTLMSHAKHISDMFFTVLRLSETEIFKTVLYSIGDMFMRRESTMFPFLQACLRMADRHIPTKKTRIIPYNAMKLHVGVGIHECIVCYSESTIVLTKCNHPVCYSCLKRLKFSCPYRCGKSDPSECRRYESCVVIIED